MGIEPTPSAWEAEVLPLNYTRFSRKYSTRFPPRRAIRAARADRAHSTRRHVSLHRHFATGVRSCEGPRPQHRPRRNAAGGSRSSSGASQGTAIPSVASCSVQFSGKMALHPRRPLLEWRRFTFARCGASSAGRAGSRPRNTARSRELLPRFGRRRGRRTARSRHAVRPRRPTRARHRLRRRRGRRELRRELRRPRLSRRRGPRAGHRPFAPAAREDGAHERPRDRARRGGRRSAAARRRVVRRREPVLPGSVAEEAPPQTPARATRVRRGNRARADSGRPVPHRDGLGRLRRRTRATWSRATSDSRPFRPTICATIRSRFGRRRSSSAAAGGSGTTSWTCTTASSSHQRKRPRADR